MGEAATVTLTQQLYDLINRKWMRKASEEQIASGGLVFERIEGRADARGPNPIFYEEEFRAIEKNFPNFKLHIALSAALPEDNWKGLTGFIHQVVQEHFIKNCEEPDDVEYYLCGPPVMVDAVQKMLDNNGIPPEMVAFDKFG